jgi:cell division protein ZapA (FtsZ GTPase activity inhibitor)
MLVKVVGRGTGRALDVNHLVGSTAEEGGNGWPRAPRLSRRATGTDVSRRPRVSTLVLTDQPKAPYNRSMASGPKNTVSVEIGGTPYRMVTDTDADHLRRLSDQVNQRIDALGAKATRALGPAQILAIVSLTMAEELEGLERQLSAQKEATQQAVRTALGRIDAALLAANAVGDAG